MPLPLQVLESWLVGGSSHTTPDIDDIATIAGITPKFDSATNAFTIIDYDHHEIHDECAFHCHFENLCTNTNEMTVIAFNTPDNTKWLHLIAVAGVTSIARASIIRSPSIDNGEGTDLTIYNRNENSDETSGVSSIEATPEVGKATSFDEAQAPDANITTTTTIDSIVVGAPGGNPAQAGIGGMARGSREWILKQDTQYAFMIQSLSDDDNYHTIELNWYEHISL